MSAGRRFGSSKGLWSIAPAVLLCMLMAACGGGGTPTSPTSAGGTSGTSAQVPLLLSPTNGGFVQQNDPQTECRNDPVYGYGFRVLFEWRAVNGYNTYQLQLKNLNASVPLLDTTVSGTRFDYRACAVLPGFADGWQWKVRAARSGVETEWSQPFFLNFTSCRLLDGRMCGEQPR
jgi:hypothetical protein